MSPVGPSDRHTQLSDEQLIEAIRAQGNLPRHVAIIMDGNGRWAKRRCLPRVAGHRAGRHAVRRCVRIGSQLGLEVLTLYTFSQENFNRPRAEVRALWMFLEETLLVERDELNQRGVRLRTTGELQYLPEVVQKVLAESVAMLADNEGMIVNLALAYGGRQEILHAVRGLARRYAAGELDLSDIDEGALRQELYAPDLPDPDLVIRTSGESRLSNFLVWQAAYAELLITPVLWPDFQERDLLLAIREFQGRERRFGSLPQGDDGSGRTAERRFDPAFWLRKLKLRS